MTRTMIQHPMDSGSSTSLDSKLQQFSRDIFNTVTKIVDEKLSALQSLVNIPEKISENCKTFKEALTENIPSVSKPTNFKEVINESRNEQLVQERERKYVQQILLCMVSKKLPMITKQKMTISLSTHFLEG